MSLNEAAQWTKRIIAYFLLFILLYITAENIVKGFNLIYSATFPNPPTPPQIGFEKIPSLEIRTLPLDIPNISVRLEIPTDRIPIFPKNIYVHKLEEPRPSVIKEERFKNIARSLGFTDTARNISESRRLWIDTTNNRQFEAEVYYENFEFNTNNNYMESILQRGNSPTSTAAINLSKNFFKAIGIWNTDLENAEYQVVSTYIEEEVIKEADTPFRETLKFINIIPYKTAFTTNSINEKGEITQSDEEIQVLTRNPYISNIYTYAAKINNSQQRDGEITGAKYIYYETTDEKSYYPIMSINQAWQALNDNKASLVYIKKDGSDYFAPMDSIDNIQTIDIREIQLAYYLDNQFINYLQPIYVFKGKFTTTNRETGDLVLYLPALDPQVLL